MGKKKKTDVQEALKEKWLNNENFSPDDFDKQPQKKSKNQLK